MTKKIPTYAEFEIATLAVAELLYQQKGDRFATESDMVAWRSDPMGLYETVENRIQLMPKFKGYTVVRGTVEEI